MFVPLPTILLRWESDVVPVCCSRSLVILFWRPSLLNRHHYVSSEYLSEIFDEFQKIRLQKVCRYKR